MPWGAFADRGRASRRSWSVRARLVYAEDTGGSRASPQRHLQRGFRVPNRILEHDVEGDRRARRRRRVGDHHAARRASRARLRPIAARWLRRCRRGQISRPRRVRCADPREQDRNGRDALRGGHEPNSGRKAAKKSASATPTLAVRVPRRRLAPPQGENAPPGAFSVPLQAGGPAFEVSWWTASSSHRDVCLERRSSNSRFRSVQRRQVSPAARSPREAWYRGEPGRDAQRRLSGREYGSRSRAPSRSHRAPSRRRAMRACGISVERGR